MNRLPFGVKIGRHKAVFRKKAPAALIKMRRPLQHPVIESLSKLGPTDAKSKTKN
jgi:hypothetical protein